MKGSGKSAETHKLSSRRSVLAHGGAMLGASFLAALPQEARAENPPEPDAASGNVTPTFIHVQGPRSRDLILRDNRVGKTQQEVSFGDKETAKAVQKL